MELITDYTIYNWLYSYLFSWEYVRLFKNQNPISIVIIDMFDDEQLCKLNYLLQFGQK